MALSFTGFCQSNQTFKTSTLPGRTAAENGSFLPASLIPVIIPIAII